MEFLIDYGLTGLCIFIQLIILGFCAYYYLKTKYIEGILLFLAALLSILYTPIDSLPSKRFVNGLLNMQQFQLISSLYNLFSLILYTIGFSILVIRFVKIYKSRF